MDEQENPSRPNNAIITERVVPDIFQIWEIEALERALVTPRITARTRAAGVSHEQFVSWLDRLVNNEDELSDYELSNMRMDTNEEANSTMIDDNDEIPCGKIFTNIY